MIGACAAPNTTITVNGRALSDAELGHLVSATVEQRLSSSAQAQVTFVVAAVGDVAPNPLPHNGDDVVITVDDAELFSGTVTAVENNWSSNGVRTHTVRAHDGLHRLAGVRRTDTFVDTDVIDLIGIVAERNNLSVDDRSSGGHRPVAVVLQYGESDLSFIRRLCKRRGVAFAAAGDQLIVFDATGFDPATDLSPETIIELGVDTRADRLDGADEIGVVSWHTDGDRAGSSGGDSAVTGLILDPDEADSLRRTLQAERDRDRVVAAGRITGDPTVTPGRLLNFASVTETPGPLMTATATHRIETVTGYTTDFSTDPAEAASLGSHTTGTGTYERVGAGFTLARVTSIDDPEDRGRIQVSLTAYNDIKTGWLPVVCPGLGESRGMLAIPDVGDAVIVLGPADDVGRGVVLGGIAVGTDLPDPSPVSGSKNRRIVTRLPNGARLVIEDNGIVLTDGSNSRLEFRRDQVVLHADSDMEIAAPGRRLVFRADEIDFVRS